jgi:hypothetical protein
LKIKADQEAGMARNFNQNRASDPEIDLENEIWNTIRYLDPDRELTMSNIVVGVIWILLFVFLGMFIFLLHH